LRDVAEEVELHESTVSRVTTNKYMLTPRGLFELKYFFSSHVGTTSGGEASSTAIRAMIKKLFQMKIHVSLCLIMQLPIC
jgi:RNA polymerase sigma-54 factor